MVYIFCTSFSLRALEIVNTEAVMASGNAVVHDFISFYASTGQPPLCSSSQPNARERVQVQPIPSSIHPLITRQEHQDPLHQVLTIRVRCNSRKS